MELFEFTSEIMLSAKKEQAKIDFALKSIDKNIEFIEKNIKSEHTEFVSKALGYIKHDYFYRTEWDDPSQIGNALLGVADSISGLRTVIEAIENGYYDQVKDLIENIDREVCNNFGVKYNEFTYKISDFVSNIDKLERDKLLKDLKEMDKKMEEALNNSKLEEITAKKKSRGR